MGRMTTMSTWTCGTIWLNFVTIYLPYVTVFLSLESSLFIIFSSHSYSLPSSAPAIYSLHLHTLPLHFPLLHHPQSPSLFALSPSPLTRSLLFILPLPFNVPFTLPPFFALLCTPSPLHSPSHLQFPLPSPSLSSPLTTPLYSHNEGTVTKSQSHNQMSNLTGYGHGGDGSNDIESRDGW
jgi:hypothetical protein